MQSSFQHFLRRSVAVFVAVLLAAWLYVTSFSMAFLESGYPSWVAKSTMLRNCELGQVAFFGDSRLDAGIVPALLPVPASNFGLPAGTPIETKSAVRRALLCPKIPEQVIISLGADHFGPLDQFFWINDLSYGFISYGELWEAERLATELGDNEALTTAHTPEGLSGPIRDWMYALHFPSLYFGRVLQGRLIGRYASNRARLMAVLESRGFWEYGSTPGDGEFHVSSGSFKKTPLQVAEFEQTLSLLNTKSVDVALLFMPIARNSEPNLAVENAFLAYMRDVTRRFPNVRIVGSHIPHWPTHLFLDGAHLIGAGARLFSEQLGNCMVRGRIIPECDLDWHGAEPTVGSLPKL